jgi:hypothetical protein
MSMLRSLLTPRTITARLLALLAVLALATVTAYMQQGTTKRAQTMSKEQSQGTGKVNSPAPKPISPLVITPAAVSSITAIGTAFTENFDGIGSSATATLPTGWKVDSATQTTAYASATNVTTQAAGTSGTGIVNSSSSGGTYNFANGVTASSTDRAVGWLTSTGYTSPRQLFVQLTNNTGVTVTSFTIAYDIEKYRSGTRAFDINFFSSTDGSTWLAQTAGDQSYAADANNTTVSNPPSTTSKSVAITGLSIANGANYYLRWSYTGSGGSSNGQGLGIDNFSVTVPASTLKFRSAATGNWNANATWEMSTDGTNWVAATQTPTSANDTITVRSPHVVSVTANVDADQLTINSGATVSVNSGVTFTIADGTGTDLTDNGTLATAGTINDNGQAIINSILQINEGGFPGGGTGTYAYDQINGVLVFNNSTGPYGVNNNNYWPATNGPQNVTVQNTGGIQMNVAHTVNLLFQYAAGVSGAGNLTLNGTSQVNTGGFVSGSPTYGASSLLKYNTGGTYGRNGEWLPNVTSGAGYPYNVQLSNNTTLDLPNNSSTQPFQMGGNLTIDSGSTMQMAGSTPMTQPLTVIGSVINNGTFTLSTLIGGDLKVGLNWTNNGTLNHNNRAITFNGTQNQTIGGANSTTFAYLFISNTGTTPNNVVSLAKDTTVTQALNITSGKFDQGASFNLTTNAVTVSLGATFQNQGTGDLTLSGDVSNSGTISFDGNGNTCGQPDDILIRSSVNGTQRAWNGVGTFSMTDVDVKDQAGTAAIVVRNGTDSGNNSANWVFFAGCTGAPYTWNGTTLQDWNVGTNWTPTRVAPDPGDILTFNGTTTPAPIVNNVPTQTIAALRLINGVNVTLNTTAANTLTINGATGSDLTVPSGTTLTLGGANALTINVASGSTGTVGGLFILQDGPHRLIGNAANAVTFQNGAICTTAAGETANPFGTGAAGDGTAGSIIFNSGSNYFHNAGQSPFGAAGNPSIAVFQTGSTANWLANTGFQASGRTYSNLILGKSGVNPVTVTLSDSGGGNFQFDNLQVLHDSSLTYNGSGSSAVNIRGDITSDGTGAPSNDVSLTAGTGGITLNKAGTQTFNATGAAKSVTFGSNATVNAGTTLALTNRIVNVTSGTLSVPGSLTRTTGYVIGNLLKPLVSGLYTFEVGTTNGYSPLDVNVQSGAGNLTARATQGPQPNMQNPALALQRYWTLTGTGMTADLTFHYLDPTDISGNESNYIIIKHETNFTTPAGTVDTTNNTFTVPGVSSFSDWTLAEPIAPTAVNLINFNATSDNGLVRLEWNTGYEARNLGFNLYREQEGKRTRVTRSMVAGSALLTGPRSVLTAGHSYTWWDTPAQVDERVGPVQYWLEDVDINGTRTLHGPITPSTGETSLRGINRQQSGILGQREQSGIGTGTGVQLNNWPASWSKQQARLNAPLVASADASAQQRNIAGMRGVKFNVNRNGWYRLTQPELINAGLDPNTNNANLRLYANGVEVPFKLNSTSGQGLNPADTIEFYAYAYDSPTDGAQTYYLVQSNAPGKRIIRFMDKDPQPLPAPGGPISFNFIVERKERVTFFPGLDNGDADNFFGQIITGDSSNPVSESLNVNHLNTAGAAGTLARLEISLQGVTSGNHSVRVLFNNTDVGTINFADTEHANQSLSIPASSIMEGLNNVQLTSLGGDQDISLADTIRLTYAHTFVADNDALSISVNSEATTRVNGFTTGAIRVMDITDPNNTQELNPSINQQPDGTFSADVQIPGTTFRTARTLLLFADTEAAHPVAVRNSNPSQWGFEDAGADFLIVAHRDLLESVKPLAELRRSQGMTVDVIDVEDLYDEFSFGMHTPQATRDFISYALDNWKLKPRYLLLVGDATYDPRNYLGQGANDMVPTKLLWATDMKTASDDWMADINGDGVPELGVGRLPVRTVSEADTLVGKIVNYVPGQSGQGALLVADHASDNDFEGASNAVGQQLPAGMQVQFVNRGTQDNNTVRSQIIGGLNNGPQVVNYFGHGSVGLWTGAGLLTNADAANLANGNRLPLFTMMTCLNGYFQDVSGDSLAEALLKAQNGGAVAVWASSGQTNMAGQLQVAQPLYQLLFGSQPQTLGDAVRGAKTATTDQDVRRSWVFFGDPTQRIR